MKKKVFGIPAIILVLLTIGFGSAGAAGLVTSDEIKNFTIRNVDLHRGSVDARVLEPGAVGRSELATGLESALLWATVPSGRTIRGAVGGDFESGAAGWKLSGARVVDGNEPWRVGDAGDAKSLSIPAGTSATSPVMCAGLDHLFMRYFAKSKASLLGTLTSHLRVEVLVETSTGATLALPLGIQALTTSWSPSLPVPVVGNLLPLLPGEHTPVAFRFTAQGADFTVDDVWVDPYGRK
jgi:hypothetical protein